jgi:hypothetical protein
MPKVSIEEVASTANASAGQLPVAVKDDVARNGWVASASADNALATATKAGEAGKSHYVTTITASFSAAATALLQVKDGAAVIAEHYVKDGAVIALPTPIKITAGNAVSAELAASGTTGTIGKVTLVGFTA